MKPWLKWDWNPLPSRPAQELDLYHRDETIPGSPFSIRANLFCLQISYWREGTLLLISLMKKKGILFNKFSQTVVFITLKSPSNRI